MKMKINLMYAVCSVILSILLINDTYAKSTITAPGVEVNVKLEHVIKNDNNNNNETNEININLEAMDILLVNGSSGNISEIQTLTASEKASNVDKINTEEINLQKNRIENTNFEHINDADKSDDVNLNDEKSKVNNLYATLLVDETKNKISDDAIDDDEDYLNRAKFAKKMITFMNQSIDPCDDFYEYACGNWKNTLVVGRSRNRRGNVHDINLELADMVEKLLEEPIESLELKYADELKKIRSFYQSCLEADLYPQPKSQAYLDIIKSIGGFPAVDETWDSENFNWFNMSAHLSNYGGGGFTNEDIIPLFPFPPYFELPAFGFDIIVHSDNINTNTTRGYMLNEKRMREYLTLYGVREPKITESIASVFELWHAILNVMDEFHEDKHACRELGDAKNITEWSPWNVYFYIAWPDIDFSEVRISHCPCPYLYTKLDEICNERKEAAANYLAMKFLFRMDAHLENRKFQRQVCNMKVISSSPYLINKLYMAQHFHPEVRTEVLEITKEIQNAFRKTIEKLDWLDEETRNEALEKESSIKIRIGSYENDELMDRLIHEIRNLTIEQTNYEKNNIEITKFKQSLKRYIGLHYKELPENVKPLEFLIGMQVNAFYDNMDNSIYVLAGILHPPVYHRSWPFSLKYGTLGYLIGHEFTHGFDTAGALYDKNGDFHIWWSNKSQISFENRTNCYIEKFNEYIIPEIMRNVDGSLTKDENIADNGGLRNALNAYHNYIKELSSDENQTKKSILEKEYMPGLDLTPEQLFFLGFAQLFCSDYKEEHYWEDLTDGHAADKYRVLGTVSNLDEFAKAYNCPIGSKMNPNADKCVLW